ncbi:MAG: ArsR family transcriptional regulator [Candidatus Thermoplasmatota archaeon]|jgi:predicted transcriptional regulator|nr:ArsR family transcriptional regulator [Candidatus Thermoplasmatota archaeon]
MNRIKPITLNKTDKKAVKLLTELGMPKNIAKTLMYLSHVDECYSVDIEHGGNLKQPEVSIAMRELRRRKWVKEEIEKKKKKGRPRYIYKPTTTLSEIVTNFEQEKLKEIENIKKDISELKNLLETR